jgi:sterol desaturase/sphingolipid hydroxylase (fatty acid hydroxylase superfamily)
MVFGIAPQWYVLYRIITPFFAYFTHANIALPPGLDRMLSLLIVTPNMHKFHHHDARPWTNTNYGNILSCWDRLFGTYTYQDPSFVRYGLDTVDAAQADNLAYQFSLPFNSKIKTDYE